MNFISIIIIPIIVFIIVTYGAFKKIDIYNSFLNGASNGLKTVFSIFPSIIAMIFAINIFLDSGVINLLLGWITPLFNKLNIPQSIVPMMLLRPISGNASLVIVDQIFASYGPDSFVGRLASTIQGCTDTTIYVLALYFGSVKITKTRHALYNGLFADLIGIITSIIVCLLFFS
ncbi:MAG: spore maturation protein [Bacilli bacterium]|nr:spore maturation protein [Bacilli bacterium]